MCRIGHLFLLAVAILFASACGKSDSDPEKDKLACGSAIPQITQAVTGAEIAVADASLGGDDIAQSFVFSADTTITSVLLPLKTIGAPPAAAEVRLSIEFDNAGSPSNIEHAIARPITVSQINENGNITNIAFNFVPAIAIPARQKFWLRMSTNLSAGTVNLVQWIGNNGNPLPSGEAKFKSGVLWLNNAANVTEESDLLFKFSCQPEEEE